MLANSPSSYVASHGHDDQDTPRPLRNGGTRSGKEVLAYGFKKYGLDELYPYVTRLTPLVEFPGSSWRWHRGARGRRAHRRHSGPPAEERCRGDAVLALVH